MKFFKLVAVAMSAITAFVLSGCATTAPFPKETVEGYFNALALGTPDGALTAERFAADGSDAQIYAKVQNAQLQAQLDGGDLVDSKQTVVIDRNVVKLCSPGYEELKNPDDSVCPSFSNFVFNDQDLLQTFDAGDSSLAGRMAIGSDAVTPIGSLGTVRFLSAYESITGALLVTVEITSAVDELSIPWDGIYLGPDGRQVEQSMITGPSSLKSGRVGNVMFYFAGAKIGGSLELEFEDQDWNKVPVSISTASKQ